MHKASKEIKRNSAQDRFELLKFWMRAFHSSSQNPMLATLRGDKPCIKILSKSDLLIQRSLSNGKATGGRAGVKSLL